MTVIQEQSNSITTHSSAGESVSAVLNLSGLSLITVIITSDHSLDGHEYIMYVSNDLANDAWHYFRSVQLQGTLTTNSFSPTNSGVFGSILSFNFVKFEIAGVPETSIDLVASGR